MHFWKNSTSRVTNHPCSGMDYGFVNNGSWEDILVMLALVFFPNYLQLSAFGHCWRWARWTFDLI